MKTNVKLDGINQALDVIKMLPSELQGKVSNDMLRAGARFASRKVKRDAPKRTGGLQSSFKVRTSKKTKRPRAYLLTRKPHAHLIERGTAERYTKKGYYRGRVLPNPFFSDAINNNRSGIRNSMTHIAIIRANGVIERFARGTPNKGERKALNLKF